MVEFEISLNPMMDTQAKKETLRAQAYVCSNL